MLLEDLRNAIYQDLKEAALKAREEGLLEFEELPVFVLEKPREKAYGDLATNLAMVLARPARCAPRKIAQIILDHFPMGSNRVMRCEVAGPGFINLFLDPSWVYDVIPEVEEMDEHYGCSNIGKGEKVQIEFVSANPTGLLHMGNARGAALGDTLANIMAAAGFDVTREFYINDAGSQIETFGRSLEARYLQLLGHNVSFPEDGYPGEDLIESMRGFISQEGDKYLKVAPQLRREILVKYALKEKLEQMKSDLASFGVFYDVWFSEQTLHDSGAIEDVLKELQENGYLYEKDGAIWFRSTLFGDEKDEVLVRKNGVPTYFAADIAYHKNKFQRGFDRVINIWGADHHGHVARLKGAMKALGYDPDRLQVIIMQLVRLFRGGEPVRMSKRSGEYITLRELIDDVGKDAARYFFVNRSSDSHLDFDLDLAREQSSNNPVYYVQYAHARICSILRQAGEIPKSKEIDLSLLTDPTEHALLEEIAELPSEVGYAALNLEPHRLTHYVYNLANLFHGFYTNCHVLNAEAGLREARLALVNACRITLRNTLRLIGVSAPERM
ncbi:MAG: arginine--tRNA ligase [Thermacetogeniaceae bacterium]|jgi:arginyl-tRNA synthetase|nr:arginine--tRNA ligase [Syntrophomonadaceae bacterium]